MPENEENDIEEWVCPDKCPYQADDTIAQKYSSLLKRYRVFILVLVGVISMYVSITKWDKRRPSNEEFVGAVLLLVVSLEKPALLAELFSSRIKR